MIPYIRSAPTGNCKELSEDDKPFNWHRAPSDLVQRLLRSQSAAILGQREADEAIHR
jgi:hypothetical protein